jgi:hypothetical protein
VANGNSRNAGPLEDVVQTVAGLADLAFCQVKRIVSPVSDLVQRSDLRDLTRDGHDDLRARGSLALKRYASAPQPHLDALARAAARRAAGTDA